MEKDSVTKVLDGCEFFPDIGIDVLVKKSLVTVNGSNKLGMHNLLQEMGRKIIWEKSVDEPGKRCRLWDERDVEHVLTKKTATEVIEAMIIDNKRESNKRLNLSVDAFSKMKKLRLLKVLCLSNCDGLKYLSNELRLLDWKGFPLRSLPSGFQPDNLVALLLQYSCIEQLWKGTRPLHKLKVLNLKGSPNLIKTPDFTMAPNLETLILEGDIPKDISCLSSLEILDLSGNNFISIPDSLTQLSKLQQLGLMNCRGLKSLPELPTSIETVRIDDCASVELVANPSKKAYNSKNWVNISCISCYRLAENINAFTLLKKLLKVFANSRKRVSVIIPGSEIPEWFSHQRVDSKLKMPMPLNIRNDGRWKGFVLCCIFSNGDALREGDLCCNVVIRGSEHRIDADGFRLGKSYHQPIKDDHILLRYMSRDKLYKYSLENARGGSETENISTPDYSNQECDELELIFRYEAPGEGAKIEDMNEDATADGSIVPDACRDSDMLRTKTDRKCFQFYNVSIGEESIQFNELGWFFSQYTGYVLIESELWAACDSLNRAWELLPGVRRSFSKSRMS
ncbi:hypothetical protein V6N12_002482 [Hibiscus sabdariffa]|uniref:Uncharacterized protein n=1 Tax=Hibiscus sabdariffa TaxID=183260 RepID=A0ABR2B4G0_9ROSI